MRRSHWASSRPRYENMPVCVLMCSHEPGVWNLFVSRSYSCSRIEIMRRDMVLMSRSHSARSSGSVRILVTMRAPNAGIVLFSRRTIVLSCDSTASACADEAVTMCSAPMRSPYRPAFFAKLSATSSEMPRSAKRRTENASLAGSPEAKPWYAESKKAKSFFSTNRSASFFHCSSVGSTPVGLCAHACSSTTEPSSRLARSRYIPSKWSERLLES